MAFPTIQTADTKNGTVVSNSTSWTLTYPTNIQAGDLLLLFVASDGNNSINVGGLPAGWIQSDTVPFNHDGDGAVTVMFSCKLATGAETGDFTMTVSSSEQGAWRIFRVTGWSGTIATGVASANAGGGGSSLTPDPPSLSPGWGALDILWFAACGVDTSRAITGYPANYNLVNTSDASGGSGGATLGLAARNLNTGLAENPGTFSIGTSDDWGAITIAVRPAAVSLLKPMRAAVLGV